MFLKRKFCVKLCQSFECFKDYRINSQPYVYYKVIIKPHANITILTARGKSVAIMQRQKLHHFKSDISGLIDY